MSGSHLTPGAAWPRVSGVIDSDLPPPSPEPALCKLCGSGKKTGESFLQEEIVLNRKNALLNINLEFYKETQYSNEIIFILSSDKYNDFCDYK